MMKRCVSIFLVAVMVLGLMSMSVFAAGSSQDQQAENELTTYVAGQLSENTYAVEGGGYLKGSELFEGDATNGYDLNEGNFQKLTSKAQTELVDDIQTKSNEALDPSNTTTKNVSESTVENWFKKLQSKDGVGSKMMSLILSDTKPDFVSANKIYKPFSGVIGTILGLIAVLLMAFLGIVMVLDISYIALPPMRMFVSESQQTGKDGSKSLKSNLVSNDAIYAVQTAESESDSGSKKQALGIYLKRRIPMLILLGVCLLFLVQGEIYKLVSWILDLVSGFLGLD